MSVWDDARLRLDGLPDGRGLNIAHEAVDRHVIRGHGDRLALRFLRRDGSVGDLSYRDLGRDSSRFANGLDALGICPGDVVATLLERVPELYVTAFGTLKARAVLCTLYAAFGPEPVRVRLAKGRVKVLVTTAAQYARKVEPVRRELPDLTSVIIIDGDPPPGTAGWQQLMSAASDRWSIPATSEDDPALIHFTSGTTGTPKAALHVHQAVVAHEATAVAVLALGPGDVFWCTADPGWVTGVSYGIVAPLVCGATGIVDEAGFEPERWYRILAEQRVSVWYTAPTAIRMLIKAGDTLPRRHDLRALRVAASVGEPLDAGAVLWGREALGQPFHDTWWQTETGAIMIANRPGEPIRPGAMGRPLAGVEAAVVTRHQDGEAVRIEPTEGSGELALRAGWPSMFRGYLGDDARYRAAFAGGFYLTGDLVRRDGDGWFWFVGRADDVIKSAGRLIGPIEVESVLLQHPAVAEAGVIGLPDPTVGEMLKAFVTLKDGIAGDAALGRDILAHARRRLGPATAPREVVFRPALPKTRSGKIMRRLLKARELGLPEGDLSTLEDEPAASSAPPEAKASS
ncbi:MAG: acetate--CoA ligase [Rhodospirillales bacterium]|nr:MAG: acetate--CoA ligase [Rhodospirillales bacterium]